MSNRTHRLFIVAIALAIAAMAIPAARATGNHGTEFAPLAPGSFPVACTDVAHDVTKMNQIGGAASDFWEGNPQGNGESRYFRDILLEPLDTIQISPIVPGDGQFYVQFANQPVNFVVIVCYPTGPGNNRPDYVLPDLQVVPKMQRTGQHPIFQPLMLRPTLPGEDDPNLLPLLVVSHGLASSPLNSRSLEIMTRLASYGYVVAAPFHGDARFSQIHVGNIGELLSVLYNFDQFAEMEAMRPVALKATVDALLAHPDFGVRINPKKIGGFGASMGGASMTWLLGAWLTNGFVSQSVHATVQDPRIKAAVGYVPFAGVNFLPAFGRDNASAANVKTPYLAISGTADTTAPMDRMEQAMNLFRNSRYLVALSGVPHGYESIYADDVFGWTIPFLDAYVKGDTSALAKFVQQKDIRGGLDDFMRIDYTAPTTLAAGQLLAEEFYNSGLNHYFITADSTEKTSIDSGGAGPGWSRTGYQFNVYSSPASGVQTPIDRVPVCRFYGTPGIGPNSHFYTADAAECELVRKDRGWLYEGTAFWITRVAATPSSGGTGSTLAYSCPDGTIAINRAYNNRWKQNDSNHRFSTSNSAMAQMKDKGWTVEGLVMCAPL
jgi:dienelactone hydrolase